MNHLHKEVVRRLVKKAIFLLCIPLVVSMASMLAGCPAGKGPGGKNLTKRVEELSARNRQLEKRVAELERKIAIVAVGALRGSTAPASRSTAGGSSPSARPSIPHPPGLAVVKLYPTAATPEADTNPETPPDNGNAPPPLFGDDPGFDESGTPAGSSPGAPGEAEPPAAAAPAEEPDGHAVPVEAATLYESAIGQFRKGDYDLAAEAFMLYITKYPGTIYESASIFHLGECRYKQRQYKQAVEQFRRYIMKFPEAKEAPMVFLRLGMSFLRLEDAESAKKAFKKVIERFPESPAAKAAQRELESII